MAFPPPTLTLYTRGDCHLCEAMIAALQGLRAHRAFVVSLVDVDVDPALAARFGRDVPVLMHGDHVLSRHRLDAEAVARYLAAQEGGTGEA